MHQTDEPIESPTADTTEPEPDTEGHSLANAEFSAGLARERDREAQKFARDEARRHEVPKQRRSLRNILGR